MRLEDEDLTVEGTVPGPPRDGSWDSEIRDGKHDIHVATVNLPSFIYYSRTAESQIPTDQLL